MHYGQVHMGHLANWSIGQLVHLVHPTNLAPA
jgi:hypothetical protein